MATLEQELQANPKAWAAPSDLEWKGRPFRVTCLKTAAVQATCMLKFEGTALARDKQGVGTEHITIAADGDTYELEEHPKIEAVP